MPKRKAISLFVGVAALGASISTVHAQFSANYRGNIVWMEVWRLGNGAFRPSESDAACNGQFGLSKLDPGLKNHTQTRSWLRVGDGMRGLLFTALGHWVWPNPSHMAILN